MKINFDMDGTIANLYGVEGWLEMLIAEDTTPYAMAKPLLNMSLLARYLNKLTAEGYEICVISWLSKNGSEEYNKAVTEVKKAWLSKHLASVEFAEIHIVPYGTPKHTLGNGILFDDEIGNRNAWNGVAHDEKNIIEVLKNLLTNC
jgi:hypothetical protein